MEFKISLKAFVTEDWLYIVTQDVANNSTDSVMDPISSSSRQASGKISLPCFLLLVCSKWNTIIVPLSDIQSWMLPHYKPSSFLLSCFLQHSETSFEMNSTFTADPQVPEDPAQIASPQTFPNFMVYCAFLHPILFYTVVVWS